LVSSLCNTCFHDGLASLSAQRPRVSRVPRRHDCTGRLSASARTAVVGCNAGLAGLFENQWDCHILLLSCTMICEYDSHDGLTKCLSVPRLEVRDEYTARNQ